MPRWRGRDRIAQRRASGRSPAISSITPTLSTDRLAAGASADNQRFSAGESPGTGTFACLDCGWQLSLQQEDTLPECAHCHGTTFQRHSIFEPLPEQGETTLEFSPPLELEPPAWLAETRRSLPAGSRHLAYEDGGEVKLVRVERGWVRIGRSVAADVRLDDPSVSRRHALIVSEPDAALRVLDDRSLNGVFVNGELVESGKLEDADLLIIGRFRLFVLET